MIIVYVAREIVKLAMFAIIWGFPMWLTKTYGSYSFLWFFFLSAILNVGMFSHFEDLEKIDTFKDVFSELPKTDLIDLLKALHNDIHKA